MQNNLKFTKKIFAKNKSSNAKFVNKILINKNIKIIINKPV